MNDLDSSRSQPVLEMRGIRKAFPGVQAVDGVDFSLTPGEVHVLLGENGAGKSTLIKILTGAYRKDEGEIFLEGQAVEIRNPAEAQALGISCVYQEIDLVPQLTAAENILLGKEPAHWGGIIDGRALQAQAKARLEELGVGLEPHLPVGRMSLALQQMVEIARALAVQARILILDEPTSALTRKEIQDLFATLHRLKKRRVAIVYITHRLEEIYEIGDRVTVLRNGRSVGSFPLAEARIPELVRLMADREIREHFPRRRPPPGEELLRVEGLTREGHFEEVSFSLRRGEIVGLAGLLGAGRTALARALFGAEPPSRGRILIRHRPVQIDSPAAAIRNGIGLLAEDRKAQGLVLPLSVQHNISLASLPHLGRFGWIHAAQEESLAQRFIQRLRIKAQSPEQKVLYLSGGHQQKVVLSKWLARQAEILLFDEPTRGIDVASKVEIYEFMNQLTAEGVGILMISSEMPEVLGMSDRILVMHAGRIRAEYDAREASQEKVLRSALGQPAEKG